MEMLEPYLAVPRQESEEPSCRKSAKVMLPPVRVTTRTLRTLPQVKLPKIDMLLPNRPTPNTLKVLPARICARTDTEDPIAHMSNTESF
jgi:hypothetical protein